MVNLFEVLKNYPTLSKQLNCKDLLFTNYDCPQVDMMYSPAGTTGIYVKNKLAHYFTDAQVIRQHGFSNDSRYETAA